MRLAASMGQFGTISLFRASHLSRVSRGYSGVLLEGSSLPSVTSWCGDPQDWLWWRICHMPISKCSAEFGIPGILISDMTEAWNAGMRL